MLIRALRIGWDRNSALNRARIGSSLPLPLTLILSFLFVSSFSFNRYGISAKDFLSNSGDRLLARYFQGSPSLAVTSIYSDHTFIPWLFRKASKTFFQSRTNRLKYIEWLKDKVGVTNASDLSWEDFQRNHGNGLLKMYNSSPQAVLDSLAETESPKSSEKESLRERKPLKFWVHFPLLPRLSHLLPPLLSVKTRSPLLILCLGFDGESKGVSGFNWGQYWC